MRFLIIDENLDSRYFISRALLRKFSDATFVECGSVETALEAIRSEPFDVVISHRTHEMDGISLVRALCAAAPDVPVIMMSSMPRREAALAAGAAGFLLYDQWLLLGTLVMDILTGREQAGGLARPPPDPTDA